ncbi:MAG: MFS transporter, partial [Bdellovibrionales bacterium]|nr:MFS transporter [Bdellovibrionales bacterium]
TTLWCLRQVRERHWADEQRPTGSFLREYLRVLANKPFRLLLISYTVGAFGAALPATLILYYVEHVLGASLSAANGFLILYFLIGFLCLPGWVWLAGKMGKKEAWLTAMAINTGAFAGVYFLGAGDLFWYGVLVALSATGYGATLAIPSSMQADVIDFDEYLHGTRKEGQFIGLWAVAKKLAAALGAGIALVILGMTGYAANAEQSETTIEALRILYAGVPCLCNFLAIAIAWRYPISEASFHEMRAAIDARATPPEL